MFYDTVIQGAEILDRNDGKTYQVGIKDGRIAYIGQEPVQGSLVIDGRDHLLAPGLVNAHTHIAMTLFRSYADDMLLMDWLQDKIWPMENHLTGNDVYWGSLLGIAEMIRTGTTAFADMYFFMEATARAVASSGSVLRYQGALPGLPQPMAKPVLMRIQLYLIRGTASKMTGFM